MTESTNFVEVFMKVDLEHIRPSPPCSLKHIEECTSKLVKKFADAVNLGDAFRNNYVGPHAYRKIF